MLLDKDIKKKSLEIKKQISKDFKKNNSLKKNDFDIWEVVTKEFADNLNKDEFVTGNNAWGANMFRNHQYFKKFLMNLVDLN